MLSVGVLTLLHRFDTSRCGKFVDRPGLSRLRIGARSLNFGSDAGIRLRRIRTNFTVLVVSSGQHGPTVSNLANIGKNRANDVI